MNKTPNLFMVLKSFEKNRDDTKKCRACLRFPLTIKKQLDGFNFRQYT